MTILLKQKKVKFWRVSIRGLLAAGVYSASGLSYCFGLVSNIVTLCPGAPVPPKW